MSDIFIDKNIYPPEKGKIKDHFKNHYEAVFIALIPFLKIGDNKPNIENFKKSEEVTFEQIKQEFGFPEYYTEHDINGRIFSQNENYPSDKEIYENGEIVSWNKVITGSGLNSLSDLNKALKTSIASLKQFLMRQDLVEKLESYTKKENIWHPGEGSFDLFSSLAIYKTFKFFNKNEVFVVDEFFDNISTLQLNNITEFEFSEKIDNNVFYIYSADKEVLFAISWDDFFFLIATNELNMQQIISNNLFEGFLCDNETSHLWDYSKAERREIFKYGKKWWQLWK